MDEFWSGVMGLGIIVLIGWGLVSGWNALFGDDDSSYSSDYSSSYSLSRECQEPENPYSSGGHYAGWQWGEQGNDCSGNSSSFIEGCEEYYAAEEEYESCLN